MSIMGRISSFQTMGTVDGPGVRFIVFMQGCPLRCAYCHNPETWNITDGTEISVIDLLNKIKRYSAYFKNGGGVTISGGEPLLQWGFVSELIKLCKEYHIHTAIDTSGAVFSHHTKILLNECDLVLLDIKQNSSENHLKYIGCTMENPLKTLEYLGSINKPMWIRQVILPKINDTNMEMDKLYGIIGEYKSIEKVELLPFRTLCIEKYAEMGISFPLKDMEQMNHGKAKELNQYINSLMML